MQRTSAGQSTDALAKAMLRLSAELGFAPIRDDEFPLVRAMARERMQHEVASVDTFVAVQRLQPAASVCLKEDGRITAVLGMLWLRAPAVAQFVAGEFNACDLDLELLSRGSEVPAAGYGWGVAATTKPGGQAALALGDAYTFGPFAPFDLYSRAVTPVGRHISRTRAGCGPLRHPDDELMFRPAIAGARRAA